MELLFKAYKNKFNEGDQLFLKDLQEIKEINSKIKYEVRWKINEDDFNYFNNKPLYVNSYYFFHNGIPIYRLSLNMDSDILLDLFTENRSKNKRITLICYEEYLKVK